MIFLLDTNIVIPVEPTSPQDVEVGTEVISELLSSLNRGRHQWLIHPSIRTDIARDSNVTRRAMRTQLLAKYQCLVEPPLISRRIIEVLRQPEAGSNDEVDFLLLAAVEADSVDYLVTEDRRLQRCAKRLGLGDRVMSAGDALAVVRALFPNVPLPPPHVRAKVAHSLNDSDPIFATLRKEYPEFSAWLCKCKREQRPVWVIEVGDQYGGICILKPDEEGAYGFAGRVAKICTFKISETHRGFRFGELLLKAVFGYLFTNRYDLAYVEVYDHHQELCSLLEEFGFAERSRSKAGELVMAKELVPSQNAQNLSALDYHIAFGPKYFCSEGVDGFIVPIQPRFHQMLFPEAEAQLSFAQEVRPFGNSIRKAYLCHSKIKRLSAGAFVLFYRSIDLQAVQVIGVVEDTLVSDDAKEIARFVGKRSVYTFDEIQKMADRPVLAVRFRQALQLDIPWSLELLKGSGVIKAPPQSFTSLPSSSRAWLENQLAALR